MKVVVTSDLYRHVENHSALEGLVSRVWDEEPSLFVIAGNLGEPIDNFEKTLSIFAELPCPKAVVTGNCDVWHRSGNYTSQQLWEEVFPVVIHRNGYTWLEQENLIVDRVGICGTVAWYDYSGRDASLGFAADQYEEFKGLVNQDAYYIDWPWTDREFASVVQRQFAARLELLERNRAVDRILAITHFPVFKEAVVYVSGDPRWNFGAAYTFNLSLGRLIAPKMKVQHVISGHLQRGGQWMIRFGTNVFQMHVIGYGAGPDYVAVDL